MKRMISFALVFLILVSSFSLNVSAESSNYNVNTPYYSYTYNSSDEPIQTPAPYTAAKVIKGSDLAIDNFKNLSDVFYDSESQRIFLTDSGANAIIVLNEDYELVKVIDSFDNNGVLEGFNAPSSTCVRDGKLYVADTGNARIVRLDAQTFEMQKILGQPEIKILGEYAYKPVRIAIDLAGRLYVIATDVNDGILLLDAEGEFVRFAAAPDVVTTLWTKFLKLFMTKAQKENLEKAVPTEYSSIVMDEKGFLYLTSSDSTVHPITKLNSQGSDILNYEDGDYPDGDATHLLTKSKSIESVFVDISIRSDDIYAALDTTMGRIFVYDQEGYLLYCFGGIGAQKGLFYTPSALEMYEDKILVTDSYYGTLTVFTRTEFGTAVENATNDMLAGNYNEACKHWTDVVRTCPTYDAANVSLARINIQNKQYAEALERLRGTTEWSYYSKAFEGVRESVISKHFTLIVILLVIISILWMARKPLKRRFSIRKKLEKNKLFCEVQYSKYTMFHPFDGFWDLKHEKRGSLAAANILVLMFIVLYALRVQFSGYLFTGRLPGEINTLYEIVLIIVPLGLWVVSNWCFTTLMDGKGTMKDIYIGTAYALRPYIITAIPLWVLSHCLSQDEAFVYTTIDTIVMIWMLALIFFAMIMTHDYSLSKGIIVTILTLVGMCLMLFIALVFTNIVQQIHDFVMDLYREIIYRTY